LCTNKKTVLISLEKGLGLGLGRRRPEAPKVLKAVEDRLITKWGIVYFAKALQLYCSV